MFKAFYPFAYVESIFSIDYKKLFNKGYRGIVFDIDNTLVPHGADSTKETDELFRNIQKIGLKTLLLSNNDEERIRRFIKNIDSLYICDADKPKTDGYYKALEMLNMEKERVIYIGDQIFTDIYGANKCGIDNILVKYIGYYDGEKIGIKRNLEKIVLKFYGINKACKNRLGDILKEEEI